MNNAQTVAQIYEAFSKGDVEGILEHVSDNVEWEYGTTPSNIPWVQPRRGREGAAEFFASLADLEIHRFEPKAILDGGNVVVALFNLEATIKATGKRVVEEDEVHIWYFDEQGRVSRMRHRLETHQWEKALEGAEQLTA